MGKKPKNIKFKFEGGIVEFVEFLDHEREKLVNKNDKDLFRKPIYIQGVKNK